MVCEMDANRLDGGRVGMGRATACGYPATINESRGWVFGRLSRVSHKFFNRHPGRACLLANHGCASAGEEMTVGVRGIDAPRRRGANE